MTKTALLIVGLICASSAFAQPREAAVPLQSEQIAYGDLNLNSSNGQAILRHRIQAAAGRVCDTGGMGMQSLEDFHATAQCYRLSYKDGLRQMDRVVAASRTGTYLVASAILISAK